MFRRRSRRCGSAVGTVIVLLAVAMLGIGVWHFFLRSTPEKTVTHLLEAVRTGDEERTQAHLTPRSAAEGNLVMGLTRGLAGDAQEEPPYTVGEPVTNDRRATVAVDFPLSDTFQRLTGMGTLTIPFVLHRDGLTWLVDVPDTQEEITRQVTDTMMDLVWRYVLPHAPPIDRGEREI